MIYLLATLIYLSFGVLCLRAISHKTLGVPARLGDVILGPVALPATLALGVLFDILRGGWKLLLGALAFENDDD